MLIEKYYLTHLPFTYIPVCKWMDPEEFISCSGEYDVSILSRLTLLNDGSLVKFFRPLFLSDISSISDSLKREINRKNKPVGILLSDYNMPLLRDQLFISRIRSDYLAEHFSTIEDTFWVRCYRLRVPDGFNAAILEVFSPDTWKS